MDENEGNMVVCRREATGALYLTTAPTCFRISGFLSRFLFLPFSRFRFLSLARGGANVTGHEVRVNIGVFALQLVDCLTEVGDECLLVLIVEEAAREGSKGRFRHLDTGVASWVEFELRDTVK